jgi:hypothetical protein
MHGRRDALSVAPGAPHVMSQLGGHAQAAIPRQDDLHLGHEAGMETQPVHSQLGVRQARVRGSGVRGLQLRSCSLLDEP